MTLDKLVAGDLQALRRDVQTPRSLDATLRALGIGADDRPRPTTGALLQLATVFADRVARAAAGAAGLAFTATVLWLSQSATRGPDGFDVGVPSFAIVACAWIAIGHACGRALGERAFARRVGAAIDPIASGRALVRRADGWFALWIGGATSVIALLGVGWFTIGDHRWRAFHYGSWDWGSYDPLQCLRAVGLASLVAVVAAVMLGRACVRRRSWPRVLEGWSLVVLGILLGLVTLSIGFELDVGPLPSHREHPINVYPEPSDALRGALCAAGVAALLLVTAGLALGRRRREQEGLS